MNLFKRPYVRYGQTPSPETPYQRAAQVWDERIGSARVQARNWRLIAFGNLVLAAALAAGLVWQSTQGTVVPWVVQVDKLGEAQAIAPAIADYKPADPQIAWHLARFIEQVRSVPADPGPPGAAHTSHTRPRTATAARPGTSPDPTKSV